MSTGPGPFAQLDRVCARIGASSRSGSTDVSDSVSRALGVELPNEYRYFLDAYGWIEPSGSGALQVFGSGVGVPFEVDVVAAARHDPLGRWCVGHRLLMIARGHESSVYALDLGDGSIHSLDDAVFDGATDEVMLESPDLASWIEDMATADDQIEDARAGCLGGEGRAQPGVLVESRESRLIVIEDSGDTGDLDGIESWVVVWEFGDSTHWIPDWREDRVLGRATRENIEAFQSQCRAGGDSHRALSDLLELLED